MSKKGPVVSTVLYDAYTTELSHGVESRLTNAALHMAKQHSGFIAEEIKEAYKHGLRDGFAQGVAAAHHAVEEDKKLESEAS